MGMVVVRRQGVGKRKEKLASALGSPGREFRSPIAGILSRRGEAHPLHNKPFILRVHAIAVVYVNTCINYTRWVCLVLRLKWGRRARGLEQLCGRPVSAVIFHPITNTLSTYFYQYRSLEAHILRPDRIHTELDPATHLDTGTSTSTSSRFRIRALVPGDWGACNRITETISSFESPGSWAFFPPRLCVYHFVLERAFPLVPHFLHVQNHLGTSPASTEAGGI